MKRPLRRRILTTLLAPSLLAIPASPALAQDTGGGGGFGFGTSSTTTWLGITVTTGAVVLIVIYLLKPNDGAALLQEYLQENQRQVAQDMSVGAGQTVDELAGFFGVSEHNHDAFARIIRDEYTRLAPTFTGEEVTLEGAGVFISVVTDAMMQDDELGQDVLYWKNLYKQQQQQQAQ